MTNGPYIVEETCLVFAKNIEIENEKLRAENEKLREALKPFAEVLTLKDCGAVVFEDIEIDHVYAARKALGE